VAVWRCGVLLLFPKIEKSRSNAIAYHFVREGVARDEWRTTYINTHDNIADMLTKPLAGTKRQKFVWMVLHPSTLTRQGR